MAPANDTESQFKFLIACIRNSQNGKVQYPTLALLYALLLMYIYSNRSTLIMLPENATSSPAAPRK